MKKLILLLLTICFGLVYSANAQTVTGVVTSADDGQPVPGVSIQLKGTGVGTISDMNGAYTINVTGENAILTFTDVGYKEQEIPVGAQTKIDVVLETSATTVDEVVVIGYQTVNKKDVTGAVAQISSKDMGNTSVANVGQMMQGKVAGVEVSAAGGGRPGAGMSVKIRGTTSINNTNPLYIIDGMKGDADMVAPSEIETIDILKDASATAIYGSQGANGVIIITTKKGKIGQARVSYDGYYGVSKPGNKLDILNASDYIDLLYDIEGGTYNPSTGWSKPVGVTLPSVFDDETYTRTDRVNMQDELFRQASAQSHNIDVSGGNEITKYRFSASYYNQGSTRGNYNLKRYNIKSNIETKIGKRVTFGNNTMFRQMISDGQEGNISGAVRWAPYEGVFSETSTNPGKYNFITNQGNLNDAVNPMTPLAYNINQDKDYKLNTQLYADLKIIEGLVFHSRFQYAIDFYNYQNYLEKDYMNSVQQTNFLEKGYSIGTWPKFENYIVYNKAIGIHAFSALAGISYDRWMMGNNVSVKGTGYGGVEIPIKKVTLGTSNAINGEGLWEDARMSYFGRFNYTLMDKYILTVNFRADASVKFGPASQWGYFPSFASAWKISEEEFMKGFDWISSLKLRGSWGKAGNDQIPSYLYNSNVYTGGYGGGDPYIVYPFGTDFSVGSTAYGATTRAIPSPTIQWETTATTGFGIDGTFFNNRLSVALDYYNKQTSGILIAVPVPQSTGITEPQTKNAAEVSNKGFEAQLGFRSQSSIGLNYSVNLNGAYNINNVESLGDGQPIFAGYASEVGNMTRTASGFPIGYFYGYKTDGLLYTDADADAYNEKYGTTATAGDYKFKDLNTDGKISDADRTNLGNAMPKWTYGLNIQLDYKGFDFRLDFIGNYGAQLVDYTGTYWLRGGVRPYNASSDMLNRWKYEGDTEASLPKAEKTDPNKNTRFSDRYIKDGSYGRLKNITLGYTVKNAWLSKSLSNLRVYVTLENLATITKYPGYDPSFGGGNNIERGIDYLSFPIPKNYLFGLQLSF
jgi:TonB-linked SusC/RagA family outer membrane protein